MSFVNLIDEATVSSAHFATMHSTVVADVSPALAEYAFCRGFNIIDPGSIGLCSWRLRFRVVYTT